MLGLLTDIDYDIKRKREEVSSLLENEFKQASQLSEEYFDLKESPYLRKLKGIKARLSSLDIQESLVRHNH